MKVVAGVLVVLLAVAWFIPACNVECRTVGSTTECASGLVCDDGGNGLACLKICAAVAECPASETCDAVPKSSLKACHPTASAATSGPSGGW